MAEAVPVTSRINTLRLAREVGKQLLCDQFRVSDYECEPSQGKDGHEDVVAECEQDLPLRGTKLQRMASLFHPEYPMILKLKKQQRSSYLMLTTKSALKTTCIQDYILLGHIPFSVIRPPV